MYAIKVKWPDGSWTFVMDSTGEKRIEYAEQSQAEEFAKAWAIPSEPDTIRVVEVKRYEVRDQNGDVLDQFDSWALACNYFHDWVKGCTDENAGACIYDTETGTVQMAFDPEMVSDRNVVRRFPNFMPVDDGTYYPGLTEEN